MLVGDRHALFSVDVSGGHRARAEELPPGRYVLENAPLRQPSAKQQRVAGRVAALEAGQAEAGPGRRPPGSSASRRSPARGRWPGPASRVDSRRACTPHSYIIRSVTTASVGAGRDAPGERGRGAAVRDTAAGRDRDVGFAFGRQPVCADGLLPGLASIRGMTDEGAAWLTM